ncbi:13849_t:CDS:10 [Funneliformis geosporum]|nr:13849_t:CDS:10 [Funneliformis geosporum]
MERKENLTPTGEKKNRVSVANSNFNQQLTKIKGILTSQIRRRDEEKEPYYYAFVKLKGHGADLPVIFRVQDKSNNLIEPQLKKSNLVQLTGHYSHSDKNIRKSFTCSFYELLNHDDDILGDLLSNLKKILQILEDKKHSTEKDPPPLQKIPGKIVYQEKKKVYHKNQFHGNTYFKLQVANGKEKHIFFVYPNLNLSFTTIALYQRVIKKYGDRLTNTNSIQNLFEKNLANYQPSYLTLQTEIFKSYTELELLKQTRIEKNPVIYQRNSLILDLLFYSGIRVNELINLKHSDFQHHSIRILGKGNKARQPIKAEYIRAMINLRTRKAGINKLITPHSFRRSFATLLNNQGCNLTTIQKLLGHSHITTTAAYIHNDYDTLFKDYKVQSLLEKQHERDKQKRLENFRKDNAREDCDEKVNIYFVHTSPFLKENLSNLKDCLSLSKLEEIYSKHQHGVAYDDRGKWNLKGKGYGQIGVIMNREYQVKTTISDIESKLDKNDDTLRLLTNSPEKLINQRATITYQEVVNKDGNGTFARIKEIAI